MRALSQFRDALPGGLDPSNAPISRQPKSLPRPKDLAGRVAYAGIRTVAAHYGVGMTTVRRWCRLLGIPLDRSRLQAPRPPATDLRGHRIEILTNLLAAAKRLDDDAYGELYDRLISLEKRAGEFDNLPDDQLNHCEYCDQTARWRLSLPWWIVNDLPHRRFACFDHYDEISADVSRMARGREVQTEICDGGWPISGAAPHRP